MSAKSDYIAMKTKKILHEGVRGKSVPQKQAVAIAYSMARRKDMKNTT